MYYRIRAFLTSAVLVFDPGMSSFLLAPTAPQVPNHDEYKKNPLGV